MHAHTRRGAAGHAARLGDACVCSARACAPHAWLPNAFSPAYGRLAPRVGSRPPSFWARQERARPRLPRTARRRTARKTAMAERRALRKVRRARCDCSTTTTTTTTTTAAAVAAATAAARAA
eukprot:1257712-Prymnesium_polylepis.1